ncbi:aminotransferase class I/II-fold pyridoxal phosphate-dependent enzyme [Panacibacter ginsenosidivorans]|uniref:Aminotransferase class I/II-fold pyridoxal phosphate-dependent enzyme n=1 Tax=Panacibacter ginsenosidivorans TaxID=1813871 RepID=A0A5B8V9J8_9BACT|nr:methionine aminotransferase [Panacibacter ginsenosidivorans]QEC68094.1 aminotransferase class I/II-fold pyridoxal phosphate-dependent enzyme [Panacibacter ginsenosidivorans]
MISKLPDVGTTIFTVMSQLAVEHNAINLGQGFPDFPMSSELTNLVNKAMQDGHNQYVHMNGLPLLTQRIAAKIEKLYQTSIDAAAQITVTPGGTYAIYTSLTTILHAGDEVIVFEPAYDSYIPNIEINGAKAIRISLQYPTYNIPWHEVKQKVNAKTKAIIINSPHNPTGAVLSKDDMTQLQSIVDGTSIYIVSDEVYEHLIFDGIRHESILLYPELLKRAFVCFSFGKTYHCTGWKIGYCISAADIMKEFRKVHQFNCFSCNSPVQFALAEYLLNEDAYLSLGDQMQQKRDYLRTLMQATPFKLIPSHGSYFECYSYAGFSNETDKDFVMRLTKEKGVVAIPISAFYKEATDNKVVRFCFAKREETLKKAVDKIMS